MQLEFILFPFKVRLLDNNGLDKHERKAVNSIVQSAGYEDIDDLAKRYGYTSAKKMVKDHNFESVADFFLAEGWYSRLSPFRIKN